MFSEAPDKWTLFLSLTDLALWHSCGTAPLGGNCLAAHWHVFNTTKVPRHAEKLIVAQLVKKLLVLWNPKFFSLSEEHSIGSLCTQLNELPLSHPNKLPLQSVLC
jgi:hypothetical protein